MLEIDRLTELLLVLLPLRQCGSGLGCLNSDFDQPLRAREPEDESYGAFSRLAGFLFLVASRYKLGYGTVKGAPCPS